MEADGSGSAGIVPQFPGSLAKKSSSRKPNGDNGYDPVRCEKCQEVIVTATVLRSFMRPRSAALRDRLDGIPSVISPAGSPAMGTDLT